MTSITGNLPFLAVVLLALGVALLRWPALGTLVATAILYLNLIPIATRLHHVSPVIIAPVVALVFPGLIKHWFVDRDGVIIDRPLLLMLAFVACSIVSSSSAKSIEPALFWIARYVIEGVLLYLLIINLVRSKASLRHLTWVLLLAGAFLASLTVYQELTKSYSNDFGGLAARATGWVRGVIRTDWSSSERLLDEYGGSRPTVRDAHRARGPSLDANRYAQILIVLLPMALCLIRNERKLIAKAAAIACSLLILGGVLLTYSRGAFLGIVAMLGLMGILRLVTPKQILIGGAALVLSIAVLSPGYVGRMATLRGVEGLLDPTSVSAPEPDDVQRHRATVMLAAWNVFLDHPIIGVGPGQFAAHYVIDYVDDLYSMDRVTTQFRAHSLYLELIAETGLLGFGAFMSIVIVTLMRLNAARRGTMAVDANVANWAAAFMLAISAYLVTALFLQLSYQRYFWLLLALAGATVQLAESAQMERSAPTFPLVSGKVSADQVTWGSDDRPPIAPHRPIRRTSP